MDYQIGNIVMLKKGHPCGTNEWEIIRVGADFKLKCRGCNRIVLVPIYTQLLEQIEQKIISGEYEMGSKLPSVRELAAIAAVNPNTMQRAMAELENRGLIITNRTAGRIVTDDEHILVQIRECRARDLTDDYIRKMSELKYDKDEIIKFIQKGDRKWTDCRIARTKW